jgi:hypothetical protein
MNGFNADETMTRRQFAESDAAKAALRDAEVIAGVCPKTGRMVQVFFGKDRLHENGGSPEWDPLEMVDVVCDEATDDAAFWTAAVQGIKGVSPEAGR